MPTTTKKPPKSPKPAPPGSSEKSSRAAHLARFAFKPGQSGNPSGRVQGDGVMRKRLMKSFLANEQEALRAMAVRWKSPKYVQDMWELLAKLEGELTKDAGEGKGGISVIVIRGDGAIAPAEFREAAERRMAFEAKATVVEEGPKR